MTPQEINEAIALRRGWRPPLPADTHVDRYKWFTPDGYRAFLSNWAEDDGLAFKELWPEIIKASKFGAFLYSDINGHTIWETGGSVKDEKKLTKVSRLASLAICLAWLALHPLPEIKEEKK